MKNIFQQKSSVSIALTALWLAGVCCAPSAIAQAPSAPPAPTAADASANPAPDVTPPPSILPNSPLAQVVRLVQADVDQSIILNYVSNSTSTFNLDSEKIIYLNDLGAPKEIVTAMMQRDQVLQQQMAAANPPPPPETPTEAPPAEPTEPPPPPPETAPVTVNYFYSSLAPYGSWVNLSGYGPCWRPTVVVYNSGWQPYCDHGHWVYTDCGWYWASDYSWGVAFHYGRWFRHPTLGWCWWPNTVWGPSWVTWRYSNDYCGWAPLPPFSSYQAGVGFVYRGSGVSVGFSFNLAANCFTFVPTRNFCDPHPGHYRVPTGEENRIFNQTTIINNYNFNSHNQAIVNNGIAVQHITQATQKPIQPVSVRELSASSGQRWYGTTRNPQNRGSSVTMVNPQHPGTTANNHINYTPNAGASGQIATGSAAQNHFSQPVTGQTIQPEPNSPGPSWNYYNKHVASPRGRQLEEESSHYNPHANGSDTQPGSTAPPAPPSPPAPHSSQGSQNSQSANGHGQGQSGQSQGGPYQSGQNSGGWRH